MESRTVLGMCAIQQFPDDTKSMFNSADWYDRTIDWSARFARELPVLMEMFGSPGTCGILDAGCGTGRQATALARRGYQVTGADASEDMLRFAQQHAEGEGANVRWIRTQYESLLEDGVGPFDGVYCIGNSLAAAGSAEGVAAAIAGFAASLRPDGRMFVQILNFAAMRQCVPCVQGPRVTVFDGREYISVRQFHFVDDRVQVTNITIFNDGGWRQRSHAGQLYPAELGELRTWCETSHLRIDHVWGSYKCEPFDLDKSVDLILVATRV